MNWIRLAAITITLIATIWSLLLRRRVRDWRLGLLTLVLILITADQTLMCLARPASGDTWLALVAATLGPWSPLIASGALFLIMVFLASILVEREKSEALYHSLVENLPQNIFRKDLNHRITFVNRQYCQNIGKPLAEVLGKDAYDLCPPDLARKYQQDDRRVIETGETIETVVEHQWPSGKMMDVQIVKSPVFDSVGRVVGVQGIFWDITDRKRAEQGLRDSEALYHSLVENLPQNVFRKDLNHRITFCNQRYCEMAGKSLDEMLGKDDHDLFPADMAEKYQEDDRRVIESGQAIEAVEEHQVAGGGKIVVQVVKTPVYDSEGHCVGVQGIFWDITSRIRAEEALRESEEKYRNLVERANDGICIIQDGQLGYGNQQLANLVGYTPDELVDTHYADYIPPDELTKVAARYAKHWSGEEPNQRFETAMIHKDGHRIDVEFNASLITYERQKASLVFVRDISAHRRAEQQLRQRDSALAHVTRLSTMGQMVAGIAHEINQPLYAISNFANACTATLKTNGETHSEKLLEWTRQIAEQANRAGKIIRRFGNFARKSPTHRSTIDINLLVPESVELVRPEARRHNVRLNHALTRPLQPELIDPIQIQQVMVNLLRNAIEAVADVTARERRVVIRTRVVRDNVEVAVEDNGPGLPAEETDKLFDAFHTTKPDGMGMGLAICRSIIEAHGGRIWPTRNEDHGATFHFSLPVNSGAEQE